MPTSLPGFRSPDRHCPVLHCLAEHCRLAGRLQPSKAASRCAKRDKGRLYNRRNASSRLHRHDCRSVDFGGCLLFLPGNRCASWDGEVTCYRDFVRIVLHRLVVLCYLCDNTIRRVSFAVINNCERLFNLQNSAGAWAVPQAILPTWQLLRVATYVVLPLRHCFIDNRYYR